MPRTSSACGGAAADASQAWISGSSSDLPSGLVHSSTRGGGTSRLGGVVSTTVIVELRSIVLSQSSIAVKVTRVTAPGTQPLGKSGGDNRTRTHQASGLSIV